MKLKKILSFSLACVMAMGLMVPAWAEEAAVPFVEDESSYQEVIFEKTGEDEDFVYFTAELPVATESQIAVTSTTVSVPVVATLQTAVNKKKGKVALQITVTTTAGKIKSGTCSYARVSGDMGKDTHYNLSASNALAKKSLYINDMFTGLTKNVEEGTVKVTVSAGSFSGPNELTGTFLGCTGTIDLADC